MSTPPTPNADWRANLQPMLAALESDRRRAQKTISKSAIVIGVLAVLALFPLLIMDSFSSPLLMLLPIILGSVIYAFVYSSATSTYRAGFKIGVLPQLVQACAQEIGGHLEYSAGMGISESEFRSSDLFRSPDRYASEDLIAGEIGKTAVRFSEVHAEYEQKQTDGKTTRTEYHTIFQGLFYVADFNKNFEGATFVLPDTAEQIFGRFGQSLQQLGAQFSFGARELVRLEDPEFERKFAVYSTDQIEARYILSPALMRRLLEFRAHCKTDIRIAFSGSNMIVAIPVSVGWLKAPSLSTPLTIESLSLCLDQLRFACGIVAELDLNTRIWSK